MAQAKSKSISQSWQLRIERCSSHSLVWKGSSVFFSFYAKKNKKIYSKIPAAITNVTSGCARKGQMRSEYKFTPQFSDCYLLKVFLHFKFMSHYTSACMQLFFVVHLKKIKIKNLPFEVQFPPGGDGHSTHIRPGRSFWQSVSLTKWWNESCH